MKNRLEGRASGKTGTQVRIPRFRKKTMETWLRHRKQIDLETFRM